MTTSVTSSGTPTTTSSTHNPGGARGVGILHQPKAVWAVAFASVIAFMGIGLVDPILQPIAEKLHASPSQVSLLFTSYMAVTGIAMLVTGVISSRIGSKRTMQGGLALIVVFSALAGSSNTIGQIVGFRAGWGLGNALFIATALATIVGAASRGVGEAIILYEAALGVGIATGPLVGGLLGSISWRGPFFGVAVLMAIAFIGTSTMLKNTPPSTKPTSLADPFRALRHRSLLTVGITALLYNFGFFTMLAYAPFPLGDADHPIHGAIRIGLIFCGWGVCVAISSVFLAPRLQRAIGTVNGIALALTLFAVDLAVMAAFTHNSTVLIVCIIVAGLFIGTNNTLITETVMIAAPVARPVASAAYSFVRFGGGAIAPYLAGKLGESFNSHVPFWVGAGATLIGVVVLFTGKSVLSHVDDDEPAAHSEAEAAALTVGDAD
ncbi:MAG TPA: MFS transporter [Actinopolymorphaceae bacterium]|jgi:MFS family permease